MAMCQVQTMRVQSTMANSPCTRVTATEERDVQLIAHPLAIMNSPIYHELIRSYGPLMTIDDLARVLKRREGGRGLRDSMLTNKDAPWAKALAAARVQVGRMVTYRTYAVAAMLEGYPIDQSSERLTEEDA